MTGLSPEFPVEGAFRAPFHKSCLDAPMCHDIIHFIKWKASGKTILPGKLRYFRVYVNSRTL